MSDASSPAVLIFDGYCGFCTRSVEWLLRRPQRAVRALPYQAVDLNAFELDEAQAKRAAWWLETRADGRQIRAAGHRAIGHALCARGGIWAGLGWALRLPPPFAWVWQLGYRIVAKYRRLLPGTTAACRKPWDLDAGRPGQATTQ